MRRKLISLGAAGSAALTGLSIGAWNPAPVAAANPVLDISIFMTHTPDPVPLTGNGNSLTYTVTIQAAQDSQGSTSGDPISAIITFPQGWTEGGSTAGTTGSPNDTGATVGLPCTNQNGATDTTPEAVVCGGTGETAVLAPCDQVSFQLTVTPVTADGTRPGNFVASAVFQDANGWDTSNNATTNARDGTNVVPNGTLTATPNPPYNSQPPGTPPPTQPTGCSGGNPTPTPSTSQSSTPSPTPTGSETPSPTPTSSGTETPSAGTSAGASPTGGNQPANLAQTGGGSLPPVGPIGALLGVLMVGAVAALATGKIRRLG